MNIQCIAITNKGLLRDNNEDNCFFDGLYMEDALTGQKAGKRNFKYPFHDFAVFDGMGGESYGEVASIIAARTLAEYQGSNLESCYAEYIYEANRRILSETNARAARRMGSTAAILHIEKDHASVCNVGDSRIYMYYRGELKQLTSDHRTVNVAGKTALSQHLGVRPEEFILEPYILNGIRLMPGMIFLLCTDGLTDMISDEKITVVLKNCCEDDPGIIVNRLIDETLACGGRDNTTIIIVRVR